MFNPVLTQVPLPWLLLTLAAGYLLGSIPFGLVLTKLSGLGDIRNIGSGNIGTTNVLRTGRKDLALATLLLDGGKGAAAVLIGGYLLGPAVAVIAGGGAFLGHLFPVWLKFRGGKGVATFLGVLLAAAWPVGVGACLTWLLVALVFRISSLSALIAALLAPVYAYVWADPHHMELAIFMAALILLKHRPNIHRLLKGEEPRIGRSKTSGDPA